MKIIQKDVTIYRESLISLLRAINHHDKIILQKTEENQYLLQFILSQNNGSIVSEESNNENLLESFDLFSR